MSGRKKQTSQHSRDKKNYNIFCLNFHGSGLNSIKNQFKRQVKTGIRPNVFILDLDDVENELSNIPLNSTKLPKDLKENANRSVQTMNAILQHIQRFCKEYDLIAKQINEELKFDLYKYWLNSIEDKKLNSNEAVASINRKSSKKNREGDGKKPIKIKDGTFECVTMNKEHIYAGKLGNVVRNKYIKDEPHSGKLIIILLGQMNKQFCLDLLRRDKPLLGIINFVPSESNYDKMLGNNKLRNFIAESLKNINSLIYEFRQEIMMKSVGIFTYDLPIISECMASKCSKEIFDQLTWAIYDIEMLQEQYENYFYRPYREIDVGVPQTVDITQLFYNAESLSFEGYFQKDFPNGSSTDLATISFSLEGLLNGLAEEVVLLSKPECNKLTTNPENSCSSITKINKWNTLFVLDNNKLLCNILTNSNSFKNIHLSCLEYNILRKYLKTFIINTPITLDIKINDSLPLPKYAKFYPNSDCCLQRLTELLEEYDDYRVDEIHPGYKLYTFKRTHSITREAERLLVIPTRLCFRDFTLFNTDEFLQNLNLSESLQKEHTKSTLKLEENISTFNSDENIFLRPTSLKALNKLPTEDERETSNRKSDRNKGDRKSSISSRSSFISQDFKGLPVDHHLLSGYNLDNVRQEIKLKTSKYYYDNGFLNLYEESWCSKEMNKQLVVGINNTTLYFNGSRSENEGLCNSFRLITQNNVTLHIPNDKQESSKITMNYPNGLSILYHHNLNCEQIWYCNETPQNEQRRIFTPYGCVIVFFKSKDMILIMRYNGEIYRLYQNELMDEEVEEQSSGISDLNAQENIFNEFDEKKNNNLKTLIIEKEGSDDKLVTKGKFESTNFSSSPFISDHLKASIIDELNFLNFISSKYQLSYLHIIVTTSQGKRINLTHKEKIFEGHHCRVKEWHDYFKNEAYCQRSDGVKMIWTADTLKCFHNDGTVLTTKTEEGFEYADIDEFETRISESSSHSHMEDEGRKPPPQNDGRIFLQPSVSHFSTDFLTEIAEEDYVVSSNSSFFSYTCSNFLMQHHKYADVDIKWFKQYFLHPPLARIEIFGIGNIRIYTDVEKYHVSNSMTSFGELERHEEIKLKTTVCIGESLYVTTNEEECKIIADLERNEEVETTTKCDSLKLRFKYNKGINDVFRDLVYEISNFKNVGAPKTEELYFIEKMTEECQTKGFEFLNNLPTLSNYSYETSNCIIEGKALRTTNELTTNFFEWFKEDMNKFPRFKANRMEKQNSSYQDPNFPKVLTTNINLKIPQSLQNTLNIWKFLEPFDSINFKNFRGKFKNLLDVNLKRQSQLGVNNWKKRQSDLQKRLNDEQQRLDHYKAMIKHKVYPNYWQFMKNCNGKVSDMDFVDFMQYKCENNFIGNEEVDKSCKI